MLQTEKLLSIGIDPGKEGAIVAVLLDMRKKEGDLVAVEYLSHYTFDSDCITGSKDILVDEAWKRILDETKRVRVEDRVCYVEKIHSMRGQGIKSTFTFGYYYGMIIGNVRQETELALSCIHPKRWMKMIDLMESGHLIEAYDEERDDEYELRLIETAMIVYPLVKGKLEEQYREKKVTKSSLEGGIDALGISIGGVLNRLGDGLVRKAKEIKKRSGLS